MTYAVPVLSALSAALVSGSIAALLWAPLSRYFVLYREMKPLYGSLKAMLIAGAGGQFDTSSDAQYDATMTSEVHTQLGLKREGYDRGLLVNAGYIGGALTLLMIFFLGPFTGVVFGLSGTLVAYLMLHWMAKDSLKRDHIQQAWKFPFFLDIFLLTAQSNGSLDDAIDLYLKVYGYDALGRELAVTKERYKANQESVTFRYLRNRVGDPELKKVLGDLAQKLSAGGDLVSPLKSQSDDMRQIREEQAAKVAEGLNAKYTICVVLAAASTFLVILSIPLAYIFSSNIL